MEFKLCVRCNKNKPIHEFYVYKTGKSKGKAFKLCKQCIKDKTSISRHLRGQNKPMDENKECSLYFGVIIAEKALSKQFKNIKRMLNGNKGYDFECDKGFKIDVKSACLQYRSYGNPLWMINISKNTIADYFLILLFDNRKDLNPLHVLLVPGSVVNKKTGITIGSSLKSLAKWAIYEQPIENVNLCCNKMRNKSNNQAE
jgi:hypothetical protein